ncbi:competence type IV pilus minor pilin ComGD [Melghiribacillus thermohalophilus]|nr:competence type IV pilus minor pilin ComGD [Melghiribacillus thermohalophilus]
MLKLFRHLNPSPSLRTGGFAMLETLLVISLLSIVVTLSLPFHQSLYQKWIADEFFRTFASDILLMQKLSTTSQIPYKLMIDPDSHSYEIRKGGYGEEIIIHRRYNENIKIDLTTFRLPFSFHHTGTPLSPGSFYVQVKHDVFKVIFPFGKGRFYVTKIE